MRQISPRGRALSTAIFVLGGSLLLGAPRDSEGVGWAAMLAATAGGVLVCLALGALGRAAPDRDFFAAMDAVLGRTLGGIAAAVVGLLGLGMLIRDAAVLTQFIGANMIPKTPRWLIASAFLAVAAWCASSGRSTVGRWAELAAAACGTALLVSLLATVGDFDLRAVADGLRTDADGMLSGTVGLFAASAGSVLLLAAAVFPFGKEEKRRWLPLAVGTAVGGVILAVVLLFNVALLGADTLGIFNFPTYHALRVSGLRGVLERMEALLIFPAVGTGFIRMAAELVLLSGAVGRFVPRLDDRRGTPFAIALAAVAASIALLPSQVELRAAVSAISGWYAAILGATALVLGIAARTRRR